jgi:hypothetical protein
MTTQCGDITYQFSAYLDNELSEAEKTRIDDHLKFCPACRRRLEALEKSSDLISAVLTTHPKVDFDKIWGNIEGRIHCRPTICQHLCTWIFKPVFWIPAGAVGAVVLLLALYLPVLKSPVPAPVSRVEFVSSKTGNVMVFQSAKTHQPIIWIMDKPPKEKHS